MLNRTAVPLLAILIVAVVGCAGGRSGGGATGSPSAAVGPANVAGTWSGDLVGGAPVKMVLQQNGTDVKGDLSVGGRADLSGPIVGTVSGNTVTLRERSGFGSAPLLNVKGDRITGTVANTVLDLRRQP